jgi:hypothetical protein
LIPIDGLDARQIGDITRKVFDRFLGPSVT